jgi:hypothetical protein
VPTTLSAAIAVSPNPVDPRCCTKSEQDTVASGYAAAPEVSDPPEVTGPDEDAAKPAGKSDAGSSTDSSWVPVSCPEAAASGVIDAVGRAPAEDVGAGAAEVAAEVAEVDAEVDADVGEWYGTPLVEHPATVASRPTAAAETVRHRRCRRATSSRADDDTGLPNLMRTRTLTTYLPELTPTLRRAT